jgi:hypothetical protein
MSSIDGYSFFLSADNSLKELIDPQILKKNEFLTVNAFLYEKEKEIYCGLLS